MIRKIVGKKFKLVYNTVIFAPKISVLPVIACTLATAVLRFGVCVHV